MDRGAWRATVHGIARVGHNLAPSFFLSSFHELLCRIPSFWVCLCCSCACTGFTRGEKTTEGKCPLILSHQGDMLLSYLRHGSLLADVLFVSSFKGPAFCTASSAEKSLLTV